MRRVLSVIFGVICVLLVILLGIRTKDGSWINTLLFGIACSLVAPTGIMALGYSFKKKDVLAERLAKVPEIEKLMEMVDCQEASLKKYEKLKSDLVDYIKGEAHIFAAQERKELLKKDAIRTLDELNKIDLELENYYVQRPEADTELDELRKAIHSIAFKGNYIKFFGEEIIVEDFFDVYALPMIWLSKKYSRLLVKLRTQKWRKKKSATDFSEK